LVSLSSGDSGDHVNGFAGSASPTGIACFIVERVSLSGSSLFLKPGM
jgi:hypothetical protein